jgi:N-acetylmuramoyl-L-alanine amidase-like protein
VHSPRARRLGTGAILVVLVLAGAAAAYAISRSGGTAAGPPVSAGSRHTHAPRTTAPGTTAPTPSVTVTVESDTSATTAPEPPPPPKPHLPRPHIVWKPIPFSARRLAETASYAQRHYGVDTWHIRGPHVIVEHYTVSTTMISAWSTFAQDVPDSELHELPGTCAHFIVDRDGTIYQLVPLDVICRHTVGLNLVALGIEHVGMSDAQVLDDPAQMRASLHLTAWLMKRYHIPLGDVIGHAESLTSPYHHELYGPWRCQTHADWQPADMGVYRHRLRALLHRYQIPIGKPVSRVSSGC